ncbi:uncharacterized protein [Prorops nasuta]|uniref:uncharacterized protein n=1 Tax=Prorops nasuta TaxID=863751 RepID=UPI0034CEF613
MSNVFSEKSCVLRDEENYDRCLQLNNSRESGIKQKSCFHQVHNFHVTRNVSVDAMHNILEGVARYDMGLVLNYFIYQQKFFTIEDLNIRIQGFDYGLDANTNKPTRIYESHVKNGYIIMSSSEMHSFLNSFNLIIRHKIPESDKIWNLYLTLKSITNIVFSLNITENTHLYLAVLIEEYLTLLNTFFPNCLKPKHHFLVHYPRCMKQFGPLGKISCLRFEGKHKDGKRTSALTTSRLNINRTVAIKHQLMQNYRFINKISRCSSYTLGKQKHTKIHNITHYEKFMVLFPKLNTNFLTTVKWIQIDGKKICKSAILVFFNEDSPDFYFISEIIIIDNDFFLLCLRFNDVFFNSHFSAYKIYDCNIIDYHILKKNDIESCNVTYIMLLSNGYYFISKDWIIYIWHITVRFSQSTDVDPGSYIRMFDQLRYQLLA